MLESASERGWNVFEIIDSVCPKPGDLVPGDAPWEKYQLVEQYRKAEALRQIAYTHTNNNWRNWYLTSAVKLDVTIDYSGELDIQAADMVRAFPTSKLVESFRYRNGSSDPDRHVGRRFGLQRN